MTTIVHLPYFRTSYYQPEFCFFEDTQPDTIYNIYGPTPCTDYFTDWLMYPLKPVLKNHNDIPFNTQETKILMACSKEEQNNLLKYGLPEIHKIEKINKFKRTKIKFKYNVAIIRGSGQWLKSTFNLSLYMKLLRNFKNLTKPFTTWQTCGSRETMYDFFDLSNDFLNKIVYSGKINRVNYRCKYKHGWNTQNGGNHSNNGIRHTMYAPFTTISYEVEEYKKFSRMKNLEKLKKELL